MRFSRAAAFVCLTIAVFAVAYSRLTPAAYAGRLADGEIVAVLKGHADTIDAVAISADGSLIATGSFDKTIKLWDASGKELRTFAGPQGHTGQVLAVAFSPKGDQLASGGADNNVKLWDVPSNTPGKTFAMAGAVNRVAVAADGKTFALAGADGIIKLFPQGEEKGALELKGHVGAVTGIAFTQNNTALVSVGADKTLRFWAPADGKALAKYDAGTAEITGFGVNPNNATAYTTSADSVLRFWQIPPPAVPKAPAPAKDAITALAMSADGGTALYASADKTAALVPLATGTPTATFTGAKANIDAIALSADQSTIAAGTADGTLLLWDKAGKTKSEVPAANAGGVTAVSFHPSQPILVAAGADGLAKGWVLPIDPKQPKEKAAKFTIKAHTGKVTAAFVHPTSGQVITAGADKLIRIWEPAMPMKAAKEIGPLAAPATVLALSRDNATLAGVVGKDVILWSLADGKEVGKIASPADVHSIAFNADKTRLLLGRSDNVAVLIEVATGTILQSFTHTGAVKGVYHHPSQPQVVTASADKTILVHPVTATRGVVLGTGKPNGLVVSPQGERVITVGPGKEAVSWNSGSGAKEKAFEATGDATAAAISKDGQRLALAGADGTIRLFTIADGKLIGTITAGAPVTDLAFHPVNPVLAGSTNNKTVTAWTVAFTAGQPLPPEFGKPIQSFTHPASIGGLAFNTEGLLFTSGEDKLARRFRIASDAPVKTFQHPNLVDAVAFDDTGTLLATGCHDGQLRIWDIVKGQPLKTVSAHVQTMPVAQQNPIYCVAWGPGSKQLLTASYDKSIKLWDAASGNLVKEFKAAADPAPGAKVEPPKGPVGHRDQVFTAAFTKDGTKFATGSSDRTVKLWDVASGVVIRDFANPDLNAALPGEPAPSHPGWVHSVKFTTDEKSLVSVGPAPRYKGYIAVWNVADGKRLAGAERDYGPIHSLAITADGAKLVLGCGPKARTATEAEVLIVKTPGR
jgi:WD40 repeat protein